jgi:hypothetical protein
MPKVTTWNIYQTDGHYLGQASAFAPAIALFRLMALLGVQIDERAMELDAKRDETGSITYKSQQYIVSPQ